MSSLLTKTKALPQHGHTYRFRGQVREQTMESLNVAPNKMHTNRIMGKSSFYFIGDSQIYIPKLHVIMSRERNNFCFYVWKLLT